MSWRPHRGSDAEYRTRHIEDGLGEMALAVENLLRRLSQGVSEDTAGGGIQAILNAMPGGSGSPASLAGDVVGLPTANTVEKIRNKTVPAPVASDDEKFVKWQEGTPAFEYSHVDRIQNFPIPAPVAGDDEKFIRYQNGTPAFEYAFVAMAGDVTGTNPTTTVEKVRGVNVPAPVSGNDEQALTYDHDTTAFVYRRHTGLTLLGAWTSADISALGTSDVEIPNSFAASTNLANVMPRAGALVGISIKLSGDVDGGAGAGNNFTATVTKNGSNTAVTATVTGGAGTENEAQATFTPVTFVAGDDISVVAKETGSCAAVRAVVLVWGYLEAV